MIYCVMLSIFSPTDCSYKTPVLFAPLAQDVSCNEISALPHHVGRLKALRELNVRRNLLFVLPEGEFGPREEPGATVCGTRTQKKVSQSFWQRATLTHDVDVDICGAVPNWWSPGPTFLSCFHGSTSQIRSTQIGIKAHVICSKYIIHTIGDECSTFFDYK